MALEDKNLDHLRMMTKVSHLYHTRGMVQTEIARKLGISQARVSRLLSAAEDAKIVRTIVVPPVGLNTEIEERVERTFGMIEVHVIDASGESDTERTETLGHALATVFQVVPLGDKVIGFTSWSRSMRHFVEALSDFPHSRARSVVEMLGGVGQPGIQHQAASATERLATHTGAQSLFLRVPGVVRTPEVREAILGSDLHARWALETLDELDIALVGIGNATIVPPLVGGENFFTQEQFDYARSLGAVGEINLRFMDANGIPIRSVLDSLVIGVKLEQLRRAERRIGVSGGASKHEALLAAVRGGWINVLITDQESAEYLLEHGPAR